MLYPNIASLNFKPDFSPQKGISLRGYISSAELDKIIAAALGEDIGQCDITTKLAISKSSSVDAVIIAKENLIVCGLEIAAKVFHKIDKGIIFKPCIPDGRNAKKGKVIARLKGKASGILTAERTALNFLALLSATATETKKYSRIIFPYKAKIIDTRKTIPGLRKLQKYAVAVAGGINHRMRLDEMVLIKDNHIQVVNRKLKIVSLKNIVSQVRKKISAKMKIEIEVNNLLEFKDALAAGPDIIMLDNMKLSDMKKAVEIKRRGLSRALLEASGNITLKHIKDVAACGVDLISIGALTHSVKSVDISLEIL